MCEGNQWRALGRGHSAHSGLSALSFVVLGLIKAAQQSCSCPFSPNLTSFFLEIPDQAQAPPKKPFLTSPVHTDSAWLLPIHSLSTE